MSGIESENFREKRKFWEDPERVEAWGGGEGSGYEFRRIIGDYLQLSRFYDGLSPSSFVLDLAVGARTYLDARRLSGAQVFACDISSGMLKYLRERNQIYSGFIVGEATRLPIGKDKFNRVLSTFLMRYLSDAEQADAVLEMIRVASDGGRIDIFDIEHEKGFPHQKSTFTSDKLQRIMNTADFRQRLSSLGATITSFTPSMNLSGSRPHTPPFYHVGFIVRKQ